MLTTSAAQTADDPPIGDPLHAACDAPVRWSRGNLSEFLPGVVTPLTWDFWQLSERAGRRIYYRLGLADSRELEPPRAPEARTTSLFHGWPVCNVDVMRSFIDRAPGDAGDSFERQLIGTAQMPPRKALPAAKRPLRMAASAALWFLTYPGELRRCIRQTDAWWRKTVRAAGDLSLEECQRRLPEICERSIAISVVAGFGTLGGQIFFSQVEAAIPPSERALLLSTVSAGAGLAELDVVDALFEVAHKRLTLEAFLDKYGFYGISVGECMTRSWREDPSALAATIDSYRRLGEEASPRKRHALRERQVGRALTELEARIGARRMKKVRRLLERADRFALWREEGKACSLKAYDAMRAVVRRMGALLVAGGHIQEADDVFQFTLDELKAAPLPAMSETALWRRARRLYYSRLEIPDVFEGPPQVRTRARHEDNAHGGDPRSASGRLAGTGVSPGVTEGRARIVLDPNRSFSFDDGDILVCAVTDPAWAPLMMRAGGIITDIGGMLSHGAVIARELCVPCVVNTGVGTRTIPEGALIRMDGTSGAIDIIALPKMEPSHAL